VAFVVTDQQSISATKELRSYLKEKLPEYMVPSAFVLVEDLPLTPNGKVNRQALPTPDNLRPVLETTYMEPRNELERAIASVWQEVLNLEKVGIHDSFFELGGHSLLATRVISRLRAAIQTEVPLRRLFEAPTIAGLAEIVDTLRWAKQNQQQDDNFKAEAHREIIGI
jgi:acyl carrier protein